MATPLKSASSSSIQEFTTAEENYLAYQIGLHLGEAGTSEVGSINKTSGQSVGSFSNTFFNEPVGTHPSTSITSSTTTTNVYQTTGTPAETDSDIYSPLMWVDSASQTGFKMMPDADLNDAIDRYLSTIFTNEYPGSYRLATSSPGGDWSVHISNAFSDTRTDGTSTQYNIYKKTSGTAPTTTRPLRLKNESSFEGVQEMTDRQIRYSFGQRAKARLLSSGSGIGSYQLRSSAQGSPTDPGTWVAKGTATDTKQTTSQQTFTRDSTVNFQANYVRAYTSQYATNYTKLRQIDYTRVSQINYTKPYSRAFTRLASESFTVPYEKSYLTAYGSGYVRGYTGTYTGAYTTRYSTPYDRAFVSQDEVNYTPNYVTQYLATFVGNYQGTYDRAFNTPYIKSYTNNFNSIAYLTGYVPNYTGSFVGTYQSNFETSFDFRYTGVYTPNYITAYAGTYTPNYVSNYVTNYISNYVNNYDGATYARAYTQPYTGNFNRAYTNPYTRTFNAQYLFPYVRNYTLIYTSSYQNFYARGFTGAFDRAYTPNYILNYQKAYTKSYVHEVDVYYNPNYTSNFEVAYLRNYTSNYVRNYSSVYNLTYVPTYQRAFNRPYTRAFSAGYNRQFETAYQAPNYTGNYSLDYTGQGTVNTLYSREYQRFFTVGSPTSKNIPYQTNFTPLYTRAFAGTVNYLAGYDRLGTNYTTIRAVQYSVRDEQFQTGNMFIPVDGQATLFTPNGPDIYKPGEFGVPINALVFRHISYTRLAGYESQATFLGGGLMTIIYTQENRGVYTEYYIGPLSTAQTLYIDLSVQNIYVSSYEGSGGYFLAPSRNIAYYGLAAQPFIYYSGPNIGDFYQNTRPGVYSGPLGYTNYGPNNTFVQYQTGPLSFLGSGSFYTGRRIYSGASKNIYIPAVNEGLYIINNPYIPVTDLVNTGSYESLQYTGGPRGYLLSVEGFVRTVTRNYGGLDYEGPPTFLGRDHYVGGSQSAYLRASAARDQNDGYFQTIYIAASYYSRDGTLYASDVGPVGYFANNAVPYIGDHPYLTSYYIAGADYTFPPEYRVYGPVYQVGYTGGHPSLLYSRTPSFLGPSYVGAFFYAGSARPLYFTANYVGPNQQYDGGLVSPTLLYVSAAPDGLGGTPYTGAIFYESMTFAGPGPNYVGGFASAASYSGQYSRLYSGFNITANYSRLFAQTQFFGGYQTNSPYDGAPYYERIYGNQYIRDFIGYYLRVTGSVNYVSAYDISYTNTYTGGYDTGIRYYQKGYGVGGTFFSTFYTALAGYDGPNYTITFQSSYANEFATYYVGTYTAIFNPALAGQYLRQNVFIGYYDREVFNTQYTEPYQSPAYAGTYTGVYTGEYITNYENTTYNISFYDRLYTMQYTKGYDRTYLVNYTTAYARNFVDAYTTNYVSTFSAGYQNEFATGYQKEFVGTAFETTFNAGYVGPAEVGYTTTYVGTYTSNYARNYTRQFIGPTYSADYVGTYTGAFDRPYTRTYSGTYEGPTYAGNYDLTNYTTTYISPAYVGTYQNTYTGAYTNETDVAYARAFDGTIFEATYTKDYTADYLINYIGQYTGIYTSIYTGAYNKVYTGTYTGDYTTDYIGNYETVYTRNFEDAYIQDYLGNFIGNFEGLTIDATDEDIETYTLYVRIA